MIKRKTILISFLIGVLLSFHGYAFFVMGSIPVPTQDTWIRVYPELMGGSDIETDNNGNIFVTGTSYSHPKLLKYNESGDLLEDKSWSNEGFARVIAINSQNDIIVAGYRYVSSAQSRDIFILRFNNYGILQWSRTWGGEENEYITSLTIDSGNHIYVTGESYSCGSDRPCLFLLKYNNAGTLQWEKIFNVARIESGFSLATDSSNNIYLPTYQFNTSSSTGQIFSYLLKYNATGHMVWNKTIPWASQDIFISISPLDNITIISQTTYNLYSIGKFDVEGNIIRNNSININNFIAGIASDKKGEIYLFGAKRAFTPEASLYFCKLDSSGNIDYSIICGGPSFDECEGLAFDLNNNTYLLAGSYNQDGEPFLLIIKNPYNGLSYFNPSIPYFSSFFLYVFVLSVITNMIIIIWRKDSKPSH
ncbi:MAG: hypothetical protein JSV62_06030 [Promethearchaeota archaeon]|nr:MAG: hypothetical protein JSV62_06030 [Candidatus Lokiarchaeota archaeon]